MRPHHRKATAYRCFNSSRSWRSRNLLNFLRLKFKPLRAGPGFRAVVRPVWGSKSSGSCRALSRSGTARGQRVAVGVSPDSFSPPGVFFFYKTKTRCGNAIAPLAFQSCWSDFVVMTSIASGRTSSPFLVASRLRGATTQSGRRRAPSTANAPRSVLRS